MSINTDRQILTLFEIGERINRTSKRSIINWLKSHDISIFKDTKESYVFKIDFDVQMDIKYVKALRKKHPFKWKQLYKAICGDESLFNVMMVHIEDHLPITPTTKVKLKSKDDEKIFKRLSE